MQATLRVFFTSISLLALMLDFPHCAMAQCPQDMLQYTFIHTDSEFGHSLAVSGNLAVIGDQAFNNVGSAYIYNLSTGTLQDTLNNPFPAISDIFGHAVAISGNTIVVGAPGDNPSGLNNAGTAYVFDANTGDLTWTLNSPEIGVQGEFGFSVAISGNLIVIGAIGENLNEDELEISGAAYVFDATTGALVSTLSNPSPDVPSLLLWEGYGFSVAISGNLAIVGAYMESSGGIKHAGIAYVFNATTGALIATLNNPDPNVEDHFGLSVGIHENRVIVGSPRDDTEDRYNDGSAYIFDATTGALETTLINPDPSDLEVFGSAVAISDELAVVGKPGANFSEPTAGSDKACVFDAMTGAFIATLHNPNPSIVDMFGAAVATSGASVLIGEDSNSDEKAVYVFSLGDDADILSNSIPVQLPQNYPTPLSITVCNTGATTWTAASGYALTVIADSCGDSSGTQIALDPAALVAPGSPHTFSTTLSGLDTLGPCNLQFQMTHNDVPFGEILNVSPEIVAAVNDADLLSHTLPAIMAPGVQLTYTLQLKNTGNTAWLPNSPHALGVFSSDECNLFAQTRFAPEEPILPGKNFTAFVHITSPAAPAECTFTLQMLEELVEWFGGPLTHTITIAEPPNASRNWAIYQ